ncbi:MAG: leucyl aminopeptidase [Tissierellia bacterium]|nr:leucyl aminopeptidase [Tissierellia bacterium]
MKIQVNQDFPIKVYFPLEGAELDMLGETTRAYVTGERAYKAEAKSVYAELGPNSENVLLVGLGKLEDLSINDLREAAHKAAGVLNANKVKQASVIAPELKGFCTRRIEKAIAEGFLQSEYAFDAYLTKKSECSLEAVGYLAPADKKETAGKGIEEIQNLMDGVRIARDLVNTPSIDLYPQTLAESATSTLGDLGVEVTVLDKAQIEELGMKAFLAVAEGSDREPRFIVMKYLPEGEQVPAITLIGKGLTYDSGGYALKPADSMVWMKSDMAGAASVIGTMAALAKNKIQKNVVAIIAACENMLSGRAYKNGDIVGSMKGTTIEVINTDAEGRLTLADALYYGATKVNSECLIDIATLTGACIVALGDEVIGAVTNDDELFGKVKKASETSGEALWQLPAPKSYEALLKGDVGDIKNSTGRPGGAITAGLFLKEFVEGKPWVHLDIAGPSFAQKPWSYYPKGATGIPVKTLYQFVVDHTIKGH